MRKSPEHVNKLTARDQFALLNYVQANYAASQLSDVAFAEKAAAALALKVTAHNVRGAREVFDLPSNTLAAREAAKQPYTRLERVEARLETLERMARELGWPVPHYE
jgi:hypothetical protein